MLSKTKFEHLKLDGTNSTLSTVTETSRTQCLSLLTSVLGGMSKSSTVSCLTACLAGVWGQNIATVEEWLREIEGFVLRKMQFYLSKEVTRNY